MQIIRIAQTIALFTAAAIACAAAAQARHPTGIYCGELLSGGTLTEVETSFDLTAGNDKISGSYMFAEQAQPVEGMLADAGDDGDRNDLTRSFIWRDKYGYGTLVVTFTADFSEFSGKWGIGGPALAPWNGKRCGLVTS